jgi:hypothetical protein
LRGAQALRRGFGSAVYFPTLSKIDQTPLRARSIDIQAPDRPRIRGMSDHDLDKKSALTIDADQWSAEAVRYSGRKPLLTEEGRACLPASLARLPTPTGILQGSEPGKSMG